MGTAAAPPFVSHAVQAAEDRHIEVVESKDGAEVLGAERGSCLITFRISQGLPRYCSFALDTPEPWVFLHIASTLSGPSACGYR